MSALSRDDLAYLRSVAEGLPRDEAAKRYLHIVHAAQAITAHRDVVDRARAHVRRRGDSRWRLIGVEIQEPANLDIQSRPTLDAWAEEQGLDDWSEDDLQAMYAEHFPPQDETATRRQARNERLRARRLSLLLELEKLANVPAAPSDLLVGWFDHDLAGRLNQAGLLTLRDLATRIAQGGRWWRGIVRLGPLKAERLASQVEQLLGRQALVAAAPRWAPLATGTPAKYSGANGINRAPASQAGHAGLQAQDDRAAVRAWVAARAGSPRTASLYEREAERFILFCVLERDKAMSDATAEDCTAYIDFLRSIPDAWISKRKVPRFSAGWAPFSGQLKLCSQQQAIIIVGALFGWLVEAGYLVRNPWTLINNRLGDEPEFRHTASRALPPATWRALMDHLDTEPDCPSHARLRWVCVFSSTTGLRSAELLRAERQHFDSTPDGWVLRVHGKGRKNRLVPIPEVAMAATRDYFIRRGLDFDAAEPRTPLLASLVDAQPLSYSSFYETFKAFVARAVRRSDLPLHERLQATVGGPHRLRHTYGTTAAEAGMPLDVLMDNLGQVDPRTTGRYFRAHNARRHAETERVFTRQREQATGEATRHP